jgi:hypothetical protein
VAAFLAVFLSGPLNAIAGDNPKVAVKIDAKQVNVTPEEVAYQTLLEFVPWVLARAQKFTAMGEAERRAIFKEFADRQMWRIGIPAGDDLEG